MFAYRHSFHAGNHADVLKHLVLSQVLGHLNQKDKPYQFIDTHAGAGGYALLGEQAQTTHEYEGGIGALWDRGDLPAPVADYVARVRAFNGPGKLHRYPGSPEIARTLLRPQDSLRLHELHPAELKILAAHHAGRAHTEVHGSDGFGALRAHWPPPSRRGAALIDPPYELKSDYAQVVATVRDGLQRFAEGVVMVWYPQLALLAATELPKRLKASAPKGWLHARLTVRRPDAKGFGLVGSGLVVVNPPWTLHAALAESLPFLATALAQDDSAGWLLEQHAV